MTVYPSPCPKTIGLSSQERPKEGQQGYVQQSLEISIFIHSCWAGLPQIPSVLRVCPTIQHLSLVIEL